MGILQNVLYISSNAQWSGSEELWTKSASDLIKRGYTISISAPYQHKVLENLTSRIFDFRYRHKTKTFFDRLIERITSIRFKDIDLLKQFIQEINPGIIIISQGNNLDSDGVMQCCKDLKLPYVTITQLVTEVHFININEFNLPILQDSYLNARKNFFVSSHNLELNNLMLGMNLPNSEVIYNPSKISSNKLFPFPDDAKMYKVGLVGRIEFLHKGYDLLLQIAAKEKWRNRNIEFNVYGTGQHINLLKENISRLEILSINLRGHVENIYEVWKENQILLMPSRMEGQALALIEAMYSQRSAIITNVGGAAELIEDSYNGFVAEAATVDSVDSALERAWEHRLSWKQLGLNAEESIKAKYPDDAAVYFNNKFIDLIDY